jgi:hypothetical protein
MAGRIAMAEARPVRTVHEAGAGRKLFLALAFLVLLPFWASLPVMLIQRLMHGLWFDTVELALFALLFTALMALLGIQLYHALRSATPRAGSPCPRAAAPRPMLRLVDREVPYEQIQAVETRCVLFGRTFAPVLMRATRLLTRDGEHIRLGNVNEDNVDKALPFPEIGTQARRPRRLRGGGRRHGAAHHRTPRAGLPRPQDRHRGEPAADRRGAGPCATWSW